MREMPLPYNSEKQPEAGKYEQNLLMDNFLDFFLLIPHLLENLEPSPCPHNLP